MACEISGCLKTANQDLQRSLCVTCGKIYCGQHLRIKNSNGGSISNQCYGCYNPEVPVPEASIGRLMPDSYYISNPETGMHVYTDHASSSYVGRPPENPGDLTGICIFTRERAEAFLTEIWKSPGWVVTKFGPAMRVEKIIYPVKGREYAAIGLTLNVPEGLSSRDLDLKMEAFNRSKDHRLLMQNPEAFNTMKDEEYQSLGPDIYIAEVVKITH